MPSAKAPNRQEKRPIAIAVALTDIVRRAVSHGPRTSTCCQTRLEKTLEGELQAIIDVDLVAAILLTRSALPAQRASGDAMVVNVASGIALMGVPFYATYAGTKASLARFGEALRREVKGEGVHVLTAYPGGTDTPMRKSNRAWPEKFFPRLYVTPRKKIS